MRNIIDNLPGVNIKKFQMRVSADLAVSSKDRVAGSGMVNA